MIEIEENTKLFYQNNDCNPKIFDLPPIINFINYENFTV